MNRISPTKRLMFLAPRGWLGLLLLAVCWPLNWTLPGLRTAYLFFPLWLGYILVVDALVLGRTGTSPWTRSRQDFVLLFVASASAWWLFEVINRRTSNWEYLGSNTFTDLEYYLLCTVSFSTGMPAVFGTAELVRSIRWLAWFASGPRLAPTPALNLGMFVSGAAMLALTLAWPKYCYPFVWTSLVLILEPVNCWLGRRHFLQTLQRGDWRLVAPDPEGGYLRVLLGDVELLLVSQMGLSHAGCAVPALVRDAAARLRRLCPLRARTVGVKEPPLAMLAGTATGRNGLMA
jgi:hypothetical protein